MSELDEAIGKLSAAALQSSPKDDQIIAGHIRDSVALLLKYRHTAIPRLKERLDTRLNDHLCGMKEGHDDSIVGFNEAWDIMRKMLAEPER